MPRRCQQGILYSWTNPRHLHPWNGAGTEELLLPTRAHLGWSCKYSEQGPNMCYDFTGAERDHLLADLINWGGHSILELEVEEVMRNKSGKQLTCLYYRQPGLGLHMLRLRRAAAGWKSLGLHKASASFWFLLCLCVSQQVILVSIALASGACITWALFSFCRGCFQHACCIKQTCWSESKSVQLAVPDFSL